MNDLSTLQRLVDEAPGTGDYMCPICFHRFETHPEKVGHLESAHGFEPLEITVGHLN